MHIPPRARQHSWIELGILGNGNLAITNDYITTYDLSRQILDTCARNAKHRTCNFLGVNSPHGSSGLHSCTALKIQAKKRFRGDSHRVN